MPYFHTKILRLEYCNITADHVEILQTNLKDNKVLTEISLNGNPNENLHLLLNLPILSLSLRFCKIDSIRAKALAEAFNKTEIKLIHLNLSSNDVNDDGAEFVANIIRVNRTLKAFNLADNKIGNLGCAIIMKSFQLFPLSQNELVLKRKIKLRLMEVIPVRILFSEKNVWFEKIITRPFLLEIAHIFL
ncbi:unnamed protein product [Brassicogethes aeneus]|uniref:Uncharacterized protein n=1 Tax=Brassicogethes aeneus TaxID=1431903 RepID=A0A9P0B1G6_BRAAE|nr:unnamed protein product [Brassicogethes aeneus]